MTSSFRLIDHLQGLVHDLPEGITSIGRSKFRNEIPILHASVSSGRHAEIEVSADGVVLRDLLSSNGTLLNGARIERAHLLPGDTFTLAVASLTLVPTEALEPELPLPLIVHPATGPDVDRVWHARGGGLEPIEDDELWAALYLRWRSSQLDKAPLFVEPLGESAWWKDDVWTEPEDPRWRDMPTGASAWPLRLAGSMCSAPMLRHLRNAYFREDRFQWFVLEERAFLQMLATADHGVGPLFACDIAVNHPSPGRRQAALQVLRDAAREADPASYVVRRIPTKATSIADLVGHAFTLAHQLGSTWTGSEFTSWMGRPSFAEAAEWVVFETDEGVTFRALEADLIGLEDSVELRSGTQIRVARADELASELHERWAEHLADFEVVQPFDQFP